MVIQIVNLTSPDVFKKYSTAYKIFRDVYQRGLTGLEIRNISNELAGVIQKIVLKEQEICYKVENTNKKFVNLFIPASLRNIKELTRRILTSGDEDLGYKIVNVIKNYEEYFTKCYKIGNKEFSFDRSYVMGILNVTPDSFSDGGKYLKLENAIKHGIEMIDEGADIIDVGGESTRPGAEKVSPEEEIKRIIPVIDGILKKNPEAIISVDTTKKKIAEKALKHGAKIINDISALTFDPELGEVIKNNNASLILMHMKGTPINMQNNPIYEDVVREIYDYLYERVQLIQKIGIKNVFIDPGIGFGKRVEDNFELIRRLEDFKSLGYPILIGVSRKSFIGKTLNLEVTDRDTATALIESLAVKNGARIIRTHNVKYGVQVSKLLNHLV